MEQDVLKRIEQLEKQVSSLQQQIAALEQRDAKPIERQHVIPTPQAARTEQPPVVEQPKKPRKSFEQWIASILPKVFIVILVLGILWGLKVASDYGYLNDTMKLLLGYSSSFILFGYAYWMERKQKGAPQIMYTLYGGAFIVGILTTAAGAILYEQLTLYMALAIALLYIAYGILISYKKGSQSLTTLVVLTSFLLPFLLEYMAMSSYIIVGYVVLLFVVIQIVIVKHKQLYALYVGTVFSVLALMLTAGNAAKANIIYSLAIAAVTIVFLAVLLRLFAAVQAKQKQANIIFTVFLYIIVAINITIVEQIEAHSSLVVLIVAFIVAALVAKRMQYGALVDVTLSALFITAVSYILYWDASYAIDRFFIMLIVTVGLVLAIRLRMPVMQVTYSLLFALVAAIVVLSGDIAPFWSLAHAAFLVVMAALVVMYFMIRKLEQPFNRVERLLRRLYVIEWLPIALFLVTLLYTVHFQNAFMQYYSFAYVTGLWVLVVVFAALFLLPQHQHVPLQWVSIAAFLMVSFFAAWRPSVPAGEELFGTVLRFLLLALPVYAFVDFMRGGIIRTKTERWPMHIVWIVGIVLSLLALFSLTNFIERNGLVHRNVEVIVNTVAMFAAAALSLIIGSKQQQHGIRLFGLVVLLLAIVKLIFFDLAALDIIVRSVLFIVIGGAGLVFTNKLLAKK